MGSRRGRLRTQPDKGRIRILLRSVRYGLTIEQIESLIDTIEVSHFAGGSIPKAPSAAGATASVTGNPDFPFTLARGYTSEGPSLVDRAY